MRVKRTCTRYTTASPSKPIRNLKFGRRALSGPRTLSHALTGAHVSQGVSRTFRFRRQLVSWAITRHGIAAGQKKNALKKWEKSKHFIWAQRIVSNNDFVYVFCWTWMLNSVKTAKLVGYWLQFSDWRRWPHLRGTGQRGTGRALVSFRCLGWGHVVGWNSRAAEDRSRHWSKRVASGSWLKRTLESVTRPEYRTSEYTFSGGSRHQFSTKRIA